MNWTDLLASCNVIDKMDGLAHQLTGDWVRIEWERQPGGMTGGDVKHELARLGIEVIAGRDFSPASGGRPETLSCLVPGSQAEWAEYLLTAAGLVIMSEPINAKSAAAARARQGLRIPAWSERARRFENKPSRAGWVERLRGLFEELWG